MSRQHRAIADLFHHETTAWVVLGVSLAITVLASYVAHENVQQRARERFAFEVADARERIAKRMLEYEQMLRGGVALFDTLDQAVTRDQWRRYVTTLNIEAYYPGIQGIGFARMLRPGELPEHVAQVRAEGFPEYTVSPSGERAIYSAIVYLEPFDARNRRAFGYDMFSEAVRRSAMERARDTGRPAVSGRVTLVQETGKDLQAGFLMYLPVYRQGEPTATVEERREALLGFVYSPFRAKDLMQGILGGGASELDFELYDGPPPLTPEGLLYRSDRVRPDGWESAYDTAATIELPGRTWSALFHSTPSFEAAVDSRQPYLIAIGGTAVDLLLFAVIWSIAGERRRVQRRVEAVTAELAAEHAELERRVAERTRELQRANEALEKANRELESFSYSVSHDLRSPLRAINGFARVLEEEYGEALDAAGREYVGRIGESTVRMGALIDGLLNLSRLYRWELRCAEVDLSALAHENVRLLRDNDPEREVSVEIEPGLRAVGDPTLLGVVLQNLLGNAWKFTTGRADARIAVGRAADPARPVFFVRDNGAGFDPQHAHKLFQPFERLHSARQFQGTGIGLATVQRIIQRHGGEVWAEGQAGRGAGIYFSVGTTAGCQPGQPGS